MNTDSIILSSDERIDKVNDGIRLIQRKNGLTFGTDALLLAGFIKASNKSISAELGGGTGIISFLLLTRNKVKTVDIYEVQESFAELIKRNGELNGLSCRISVINGDIRECIKNEDNGRFDIVFSNPPYMKLEGGINSAAEEKNIAKREVCGGIDDFTAAASRLLRFGGKFYAVYLPERLDSLIASMKKQRITAKRLTLVYPDIGKKPCLVLIEGTKGGGEGLTVTPPFYINNECKESPEYKYLMDTGEFSEEYLK